MLEIRLLGQFDIRRHGQPVEIPSHSAQSLPAYVLLKSGIAHRREKLAGLLWPDATEANARGYLLQALWRVRKALESETRRHVIADDLTLSFDPSSDYWLDIAELERSVLDGTAEAALHCVSVYQGELLPGFYGEWVVAERERLQAVFESKMAMLLDRLVVERRWSEVLDWGERWIALGHAPEPAYRALMIAHSGLGDRSSMVAIHQRCVDALRRELDLEPSEITRALYEQLAQGAISHTGTPGPLPVGRPTPAASPANLPRQLTSFIGRESEIAEVKRLLAASASRLVTLTGSGGCGKTRLALQTGNELRADYPQGVWFVELAPVVDPALLPQAVAAALDLREEPSRPILATLMDYLRARKSLLILDNCEHVIEASAHLAEALLRACADLHILASSREALGIAGETAFRVPSLSTPDPHQSLPAEGLPQYEAVRLFIDRAALALPSFRVTDDNASAVAQICHRLDGIPLAIELAAARVKVLRVEQIAERLTDAFRLLTGGSRTALPRQQTLRAAIDWSHNLLPDTERILLRRLSVFAGGWTLEAAELVCSDYAQPAVNSAQPPPPTSKESLLTEDTLDLLTQLVNKSLVLVEREQGADARYRLLETVRQYAREMLIETQEAEPVRQKHLEYYLQLATQAELELTGPRQVVWMNRLEVELDNLHAALGWSVERDVEAGLRLAGALRWFWQNHDRIADGSGWLSQLLGQQSKFSHLSTRAKALNVQSEMLLWRNDLAESRLLAEEGLALYRELGDKRGEADILLTMGALNFMQATLTPGTPLAEQSLALYRGLGDILGISEALNLLGVIQPDDEQSRLLLEESLTLCRQLGHLAGIAGRLNSLASRAYQNCDYIAARRWLDESLPMHRLLGKSGVGDVLEGYGGISLRRGDYEQACAYYEESITLYRDSGRYFESIWPLVGLGYAVLKKGDRARARAVFEESLRLFGESKIGVAFTLEGLASLAVAQGLPERAARLIAWVDAMREATEDFRPPVEQPDVDRDLAVIRAQLDEAAFNAAWAEGRAMTMEQAIEYAFESDSIKPGYR